MVDARRIGDVSCVYPENGRVPLIIYVGAQRLFIRYASDLRSSINDWKLDRICIPGGGVVYSRRPIVWRISVRANDCRSSSDIDPWENSHEMQ